MTQPVRQYRLLDIQPHSIALATELLDKHRARGVSEPIGLVAIVDGRPYSIGGDHRRFLRYQEGATTTAAATYDLNEEADRLALTQRDWARWIGRHSPDLQTLLMREAPKPTEADPKLVESILTDIAFVNDQGIRTYADLDGRLLETYEEMDVQYQRRKSEWLREQRA